MYAKLYANFTLLDSAQMERPARKHTLDGPLIWPNQPSEWKETQRKLPKNKGYYGRMQNGKRRGNVRSLEVVKGVVVAVEAVGMEVVALVVEGVEVIREDNEGVGIIDHHLGKMQQTGQSDMKVWQGVGFNGNQNR